MTYPPSSNQKNNNKHIYLYFCDNQYYLPDLCTQPTINLTT